MLECSCFCSRANGRVTSLRARQGRGRGCTASYLLLSYTASGASELFKLENPNITRGHRAR